MTRSATANKHPAAARFPWRAAALTLATTLAAATLCPRAEAEPTEADRTAAEALFQEGKRLMEAGHYDQACPKLAESQRRDPGTGTLLATALCHEQQGKLATAWGEFREALGMARAQQRQERIELAEEHIAALEPRLPKLTVVVAAPAVEGLEVTLDGASAVIGTALPIDPGQHELGASAPGKKPWSETFALPAGEQRTIEVPELADAPAPPPAPVPSDDGGDGGAQQLIGFVVGGLGVLAMGAGAVAGGMAISKRGDSDDECPEDRCTQAGVDLNEEAKTAALVSNIGIFGGLGLVAVGTVLVLTGLSDGEDEQSESARRAPTWTLGPTMGPKGGGMLLRGTF